MKPIFKDTKTILLKRLSIISESIEQGAASLKEQDNQATEEITTQILENKAYLKRQQSEATAEISEQIKTYKEQLLKEHTQALKEHTQALKEFHTAHKKQVESLQASLKESSYLQEELVQAASLKRVLSKSIYPLIFLVFILVTCSIGAGFYLKSQKDHIAQMSSQVEELRQKGGSLKLLNCDNRVCVQIDPKALIYEDNYRVIQEK